MTFPCFICREVSGEQPAIGHFICDGCKPIQNIACTSTEEGIKYGIPGQPLPVLRAALKFEKKKSGGRASLVKALNRAISKLEKAEQK